MEYHASLFLSQPDSNSAHFSVLLFYEHCAKVEALEYFAYYSNPQVLPKGIYLAGRNAEVNRINANKLAAIGQRSYFYNAECKGEVREDDKRGATELLELKVGARIMTTANDSEYRNGDLGYITALTEDSITVLMDNAPKESEIKRYTWEIIRYQVEITDQDRVLFKRTVVGRYIQFPLKLAWAVTIHKSQGQTFDQVNLNPQCWDSGQLYVALSRVRSIEGLHLVSPLYDRYLKLDPAVSDFYEYACVDEPDDVGIARDMVYKNDALPKKKTAEEARFFSAPLDFYDKPKTERETIRRRWHMTALHRLSGCDIVFADPDNGLITPSAEGTPKSNKYVYPFELLDYYKRGASVIYYQHKARKPDSDYIAQQKDLITSFGFYFAKSICMKFTTTSQRYYFFIVQSEHFDQINIALDDMLANAWGEHFTRL